MPNSNIPATEKTKLGWTHHEKRRRRQPLKTNDGDGCTGEEKKGRPRWRWIDNTWDDTKKYELTDDMTENRQYWKTMVKTGPQRCGDGL